MFLIFILLGKAIKHFVFGGSNYTFHTESEKTNWENSRLACKATGSDLVSIESLEELNFLNNTIQTMETTEYFIGLRKYSKFGEWRWISNNSTVNKSKGTFPWAKSQPSGDGHCVIMYKDYEDYFGLYNDLPCTTHRPCICESSTDSNAKEGMSLNSYIGIVSLYLNLPQRPLTRFCAIDRFENKSRYNYF